MPPANDSSRRIKCLYCEFTVKAWRTNKNGEKKSGMVALMHHVRDNHSPTYELQRLEEENPDNEYYE